MGMTNTPDDTAGRPELQLFQTAVIPAVPELVPTNIDNEFDATLTVAVALEVRVKPSLVVTGICLPSVVIAETA
jgi:hypothetical protein